MLNGRLETVCARLCLLSRLDLGAEDPVPLSRQMVKKMIACAALDGLVLRDCAGVSAEIMNRARVLLSRASCVYESIRRYEESGYTILLPGDEYWPKQLYQLGNTMPLYLFSRGNVSLLRGKTISVAGSRVIGQQTREKAVAIGRAIAKSGITLVSGGANGVDITVQRAVLESGGSAVIVPAVPARKVLKDPLHAAALDEGRLLILCETPPDEEFSAHKALSRNHTIYALGMCALVVASRAGIGGSWAGAQDCIKGKWSPVYVLDDEGEDFAGNAALLDVGARRMQVVVSDNGEDLLFEGMDTAAGGCHFEIPGQTTLFDMEAAHAHTGQT